MMKKILYIETLVLLFLSLLMVMEYDAGALVKNKFKANNSKKILFYENSDKYSYEEPENERIEVALLKSAYVIDNATITYYDCCVECCGKDDGITASGVIATPYVTVAVDQNVIPLGSDVLLDFGDGEIRYFRADDTGVSGNHIDICVKTHEEAIQLGTCTATVYWIPAEI